MPGETTTPRTAATERSLSTSVMKAGQSMCDGQPKEYFWGCTLTTASNSVTWSTDEEENDEDFLQHTLFLRHAMLGSGASTDRHIVELETKDHHGETIKMPIFSLKMGLNEMVILDLNFPNGIPVTIRLVEGAGPVHITGQQLLEFPDEENDLDETEALTEEEEAEVEGEEEEEDEEEEEEEESEEEEDEKKKSTAKATKRKASITKSKKAKGRRDRSASENGTDEDEEEEDEEGEESMEDDEDDEDYEEEEKKSKKTKPKAKGGRVVKKKDKSSAAKKGKKVKA